MASSLDQVGMITKTVADAKVVLSAISGYDPNDAQSNTKADQKDREKQGLFFDKKRKIALPKQFLGEGLDPKIRTAFLALIDKLRTA
jgi:aspartyl-tRNA(Asn)/glutamyl-tRNA(Gln) amidotransferase subunit A